MYLVDWKVPSPDFVCVFTILFDDFYFYFLFNLQLIEIRRMKIYPIKFLYQSNWSTSVKCSCR